MCPMLTTTPVGATCSIKAGACGHSGRDGDQSDSIFRRVLETPELIQIRRPHPMPRVCSARSIFGRNIGPSTWKPAIAAPSGMERRALARLARAPAMLSGDPVITVGNKRVTPVAYMARIERAMSSCEVRGEQ